MMTDFMADFRRRAIKAISEDIHPDVLVKLREKAKGMSLEAQLNMLQEEAMRTYQEPECFNNHAK